MPGIRTHPNSQEQSPSVSTVWTGVLFSKKKEGGWKWMKSFLYSEDLQKEEVLLGVEVEKQI